MSNKSKIPFNVIKKLEELISWKQLYTTLGTPNANAANIVDKQITEHKNKYKEFLH